MATLLLEATHLSKAFAGVRALKDVTFELRAGEVHALVGENGAGKSTFIKIVTGVEQADAGALSIDGRNPGHLDPHRSRALGIAAIYQQPGLFPHLTVAENIALALEPSHGLRVIDWPGRRATATSLLARLGASIDPERLVDTLSMPEQQVVEIAKALGAKRHILLMDEPTASLSRREVERLFEIIRTLRGEGVGVVYISHRLEEVFAVADRITVLRDGESVATLPAAHTSQAELIRLMVGRELSAVLPKRSVAPGTSRWSGAGRGAPASDTAGESAGAEPLGPILELRGVSHAPTGVRDVSLTVRRGEIVGLAGLVGSGRTQLAEVVFGLSPADRGEIAVNGVAVRIDSPARAIGLGIGYVPEDRRRHGVIPEMSVAMNTTLARLRAVSRGGLISARREQRAAQDYVDRFRIKTPSLSSPVDDLSGGNQQKVALARWLSIGPSILILDEPTQGVDVGAKAEIHALMQELAEDGLAVLMISSDLPEVLGMSDRVAVMQAGAIAGVLDRAEATPDRILELALGSAVPA